MNKVDRVIATPIDTRKRREDVERYSKNEKDMKNFECFEQAILLTLLNQFCGFKLQKPFKQSIIITTKPEVVSLYFDSEEIELKKIAEQQCKLFAEQSIKQDISEKTRMRRFAKNRSTFTINFLYDCACRYGYFFNSVLSKKSKKCLQIERIHEVFYQKELLFSYDDIISLGEKLNGYFFSLVREQKDVTIQQNDPFLQQFVKTNICLYPILPN